MQTFQKMMLTGLIAISVGQAFISPAQANTKQFNYKVESHTQENFADVVKRGEIKAATAIRREFSHQRGTKQVSVRIIGERYGQETPIIMISVTRSQWRSRPRIKTWARYYRDAGTLLGFANNQLISAPTVKNPTVAQQTNNQK